MKIAIIRKKYTFHGGAEGFSSGLIENLANQGHEIHIFAIKWQANTSNENIYFHKVPALTLFSFMRDLTFAISSFFILKQKRKAFDIIQTNDKTLFQDIYRAGDGCHIEWLRQRWKRTGLGGKTSIVVNPYHWMILVLEKMILSGRKYKKIVAISEMVRKNIIDNYRVSSADIEVIYNGVDLEKFHPDNRGRFRNKTRHKYGLSDKDFIVLFVGSGFERKGVKYLIEAIETIPDPITLMIIGKGDVKSLQIPSHFQMSELHKNVIPAEAEIQKKEPDSPVKPENDKSVDQRNRKRVLFCGPQRNIHEYYAAADLFVFPTVYEPFGNVHLEALASGIPVITTRNSGAAEIIKDGEGGFVIDVPENIHDLSDKIEFFMHNKDKLVIMGKKARQVAEKFSYEENIRRLEKLYKSIIDKSWKGM